MSIAVDVRKESKVVPHEPSILAGNTWFWSPAPSSHGRRRNEEEVLQRVADYLAALGFAVWRAGDSVHALKVNVEVSFTYRESCQNVYKRLRIVKAGKVSNICALRRIARELREGR